MMKHFKMVCDCGNETFTIATTYYDFDLDYMESNTIKCTKCDKEHSIYPCGYEGELCTSLNRIEIEGG